MTRSLHRRSVCRAGGLLLSGLPTLNGLLHAADSRRNFSFGVVPQQSANELAKAWTWRAICSLAVGRYLPVLMLTGLDDVMAATLAFEAGATDFVTKPII